MRLDRYNATRDVNAALGLEELSRFAGRDHRMLPKLDHRNSPVVERGGELVESVGQAMATTSF